MCILIVLFCIYQNQTWQPQSGPAERFKTQAHRNSGDYSVFASLASKLSISQILFLFYQFWWIPFDGINVRTDPTRDLVIAVVLRQTVREFFSFCRGSIELLWCIKMKCLLVCAFLIFGFFCTAFGVQCPQQCRCVQSQVHCSLLAASNITRIPVDTKILWEFFHMIKRA